MHGKRDRNEEKNETVIDGLKKYNRHMFILKIIVVILSLFIISIWGSFIVERVQESIELKEDYEKGQYIFNILDEASHKIEEIESSGNYSVVEEDISVSYDFDCVYNYSKNVMLYKDGYFKEEQMTNPGSMRLEDYNDVHYINYGVITKENEFCTQFNEGKGSDSIRISTRGNYNVSDNNLGIDREEDVLKYKDYDIKEEEYDGINYYIISKSEQDGIYYSEIWINKDNMKLFKRTNEKLGCDKVERRFTWTVNNVKDEDVRIKFAGKSEKIQELDKIFEEINNSESEDGYDKAIKWSYNDGGSEIYLDNYVKPENKVITLSEAWKIIENKYGMEGGYLYYGIVFDQKGDAYYAYEQSNASTFVKNIFISIFGDTIKTSDDHKMFHKGDLVIL